MSCKFSFNALPSQLREIQQIVKKHDGMRFVGNTILPCIPGDKIPFYLTLEGDGQPYANCTKEIHSFLDREKQAAQKIIHKKNLKTFMRNLFSRRGNESTI